MHQNKTTRLESRRSFIHRAGVAGAVLGLGSISPKVLAAEPKSKTHKVLKTPPLRLGLAAYSFKDHFEFMKGKPKAPLDDKKINMFGFIDYCAQHHCAAELTSYFFPPDADESYFLKIKRHAFLKGVPIVGTAIGNNFTIPKGEKLDNQIADAKQWIDKAAIMGAPHVRFFAGTRKQLEASPDAMKIAVESLQACVDYAAGKGVFVGVENHGQLTAEQVLQVVESVKSDWFGVNLDTGNFVSKDPYADLTRCIGHAVNIQLKIKMKSEEGEKYDADFDRIASIVKDSNYRGYVVLEYEEEKPFENVPAALAKTRKSFER